jgi:uncharacterized protein YydD (DUF2326 family)
LIHRITSDLPSFKTLDLQPGLNILLAERTAASTQRDTRNGAGKTSLIEVIHFLTGSSAGPQSMFRSEALIDYSFEMVVDLGPQTIAVRRSGDNPSRVSIGNTTGAGGLRDDSVTNTEWREILGRDWFQLPDDVGKAGPSFRSLLSYFVRRQADGGFDNPFSHMRNQSKGDQQVNVSYLIDLDWKIPQTLELTRNRERSLKEFKNLESEGIFGSAVGTVATLRTQLAVAERRAADLSGRLATFQVVDEYRSLEQEASALSRQIGDLTNANAIDQQLIDTAQAALESEQPPSTSDLTRLYAEAGALLPDVAIARFEEAAAFNESVVRNRRSYLDAERRDAESRINSRTTDMQTADRRRGLVMRMLESGGALEHFNDLQRELSLRTAQVESLRQRFEAAQRFESTKAALDRERSDIHLRLQRDFAERAGLLDRTILVFEQLSSQLYDEGAGSLTISESPNGAQFSIEMHAKRSKGISQMQIFCFDLALMTICHERGIGPGFLVHDSHLFDGVDSRQVGSALSLGANAAESLGFQYIVTMNSDAVPAEVPAGFDPRDYVLPIVLTDARIDGGLFGIRFQ